MCWIYYVSLIRLRNWKTFEQQNTSDKYLYSGDNVASSQNSYEEKFAFGPSLIPDEDALELHQTF